MNPSEVGWCGKLGNGIFHCNDGFHVILCDCEATCLLYHIEFPVLGSERRGCKKEGQQFNKQQPDPYLHNIIIYNIIQEGSYIRPHCLWQHRVCNEKDQYKMGIYVQLYIPKDPLQIIDFPGLKIIITCFSKRHHVWKFCVFVLNLTT